MHCKVTGNQYTCGMSTPQNVIPIHDSSLDRRRARAAFVKAAIEDDDRSDRYVAIRAGISTSAFSDRLKGRVAFLADELEDIAHVLKLDPVDFYRDYIAAGTEKAPTPKGGGSKTRSTDYKGDVSGELVLVDFTTREVRSA